MNVRPQSGVIGQVPSVVIGILVDHDLIGVPQPVVTENDIERRDAEEEPTEPETSRAASFESKEMPAAEPAGEAAMRPRVIEMEVAVVTAYAMPNPFAVPVHVWRVGVSSTVAV